MALGPQSRLADIDALSDAALRLHEAPIPRRAGGGIAFVPSFPLTVLQAMAAAKAEKALPLVLAIHRQLHMTRRHSTPLNSAIWKAAGLPSARARAGILRKLRQLPEVIELEKKRTATSHYRVAKGSAWNVRLQGEGGAEGS